MKNKIAIQMDNINTIDYITIASAFRFLYAGKVI